MTLFRLTALMTGVALIFIVAFSRRGFMRLDEPDAIARDRLHGLLDVLVIAASIALAVGLIEVGLIAFRQGVQDKFAFWRLNAAWLTPVAYLVLFAVPAAALGAATLFKPRWVPLQAVVFALALVACWSVFLSFPRLHKAAAAILTLAIATRFAYATASRASFARRLSRRALPVLAVATGILFVGTTGTEDIRERRQMERAAAPASGTPNVIFLFLDTVRAASLSLYGYDRPTTPELERLAEESTVFDWAISASSWTLPGHATAFTGLYPHDAGVGPRDPLDVEHPTLAQAFLSNGYRTAGFVANRRYCSTETGLSHGFVHYEDYLGTREPLLAHTLLGQIQGVQRISQAKSLGDVGRAMLRFGPSRTDDMRSHHRRSAADVNRDFLTWLDEEESARPFFVFLNYLDAHEPYQAPERFRSQFDDGSVSTMIGQYDASLASIDYEIGRLVDELERRGLMDRTVLVITSDHGEHLNEDSKGLEGHGQSLYTQVVRVPLLVRYPKRVPGGVRVPTVVTLADLPASILEITDVPNDRDIPGESLVSSWQGDRERGLVFAEVALEDQGAPATLYTEQPHLKSLFDDRYHYYWSWGRADETLRETEQLFDIRQDPNEEHDLAGAPESQAALARFRAALRERFPATDGEEALVSATGTSAPLPIPTGR